MRRDNARLIKEIRMRKLCKRLEIPLVFLATLIWPVRALRRFIAGRYVSVFAGMVSVSSFVWV